MYRLAICIPTFNRSEKVIELVKDLLSAQHNWMQVVISDNSSSDDTVVKLREITDPRLYVYESSNNEGAIANYLKVMSRSEARYSIFLTDKDRLNIDYLERVANELEEYGPISGYIKYDVKSPAKTLVAQGALKLFKVGYRCIHPSGYFFLSSVLESSLKDPGIRERLLRSPFPFELLLSKCSGSGDLAILQIPLITQESPAEYRKVRSHSYSSYQGNLYFSPTNRLATFVEFVDDIDENCINKIDSRLTKIRLLYWSVSVSTLGYLKITRDACFREHYRMTDQQIFLSEILGIMSLYYSAIDDMKNDRNLLKIIFMLFSAVIFGKYLLWHLKNKNV